MGWISIGLISLLLLFIFLNDAWAFLTQDERARLLWWMFVTPWIPDWVVSSDLFAESFARYVGRSLFPIDPLTDFPGEEA